MSNQDHSQRDTVTTSRPLPPDPRWLLLQRKAAPDEDPAQGVCLAIHSHWGTDLQVPKGIKAGDRLKEGLPVHVAKIWTLGRGHTLVISLLQPRVLSPNLRTF